MKMRIDKITHIESEIHVYLCNKCQNPIGIHEDIISKAFHGRSGKGYLFNHLYNVDLGPREERILITGLHIVCDIVCKLCGSVLGWKYEYAYDKNQKYKEGKYIVEVNQTYRTDGDY